MSFTHGQQILLACLITSAALTASIAGFLAKSKDSGTVIREQGPERHKAKAGIPSTGGRAFLIAMSIAGIGGSILMSDPRALIGVGTGLLSGLIGLADDVMKQKRKASSGLKARYKLPLMILVGLLASILAVYFVHDDTIRIPFMNNPLHLGWWKIPIALFCYLTIINGVNFTDGLDGLAASTVLIASLFLGATIYTINTGSAVVPVVIAGICIGFLPFNWNPAKIFMGDSGSLCIGGALAGAAIVAGLDIIILIIGLVFMVNITTVVLQVVYFRLTGGKRIFRMTPIHHAFELRGYSEPAIVYGASVVGVIGGIIARLSL
ncbi:MAG TPA: phospho-N-acetylmuramoyl-pentapeptide-transferase [Firmicutes bacterium]|nr:phospho-N-acetylmuramoyl-pentapeptide-transferase [Bacillota bacterium]